jgi:hypothetical protein
VSLVCCTVMLLVVVVSLSSDTTADNGEEVFDVDGIAVVEFVSGLAVVSCSSVDVGRDVTVVVEVFTKGAVTAIVE